MSVKTLKKRRIECNQSFRFDNPDDVHPECVIAQIRHYIKAL